MKVTIKGLNQWEKWVSGVTEETIEKSKDLVKETAYKIEADAKRLAPVDTGRLRASINTDFEKDGLAAEIGTNVEYAEFVEDGTSKSPAQPYMKPAAFKNEEPFVEGMKKIVRGIDN